MTPEPSPATRRRGNKQDLRVDVLALPLLWGVEVLLLGVRLEDAGRVNVPLQFLGSALLYVLLIRRRQRPLEVFVLLVLVSSLLSVLVPGFHPILCLWLALFAVAAHAPPRRAALALLLAGVPIAFNVHETFRNPEDAADGPMMIIAVTVFLLLITLTTYGVGLWTRWSVTQRALVARLAAARAEAEERRRIARELHDVVAHSVSLMALQAAGAERVMDSDPGRARIALRQVGELGEQATEELRRMLGFLAPATGNEDVEAGTPVRLHDVGRLLTHLRAAGRRIDLSVTGRTRPIDPTTDEAGYRILQEALTNALKYADPEEPVLVRLDWAPDELVLDVLSHGRPGSEPGARTFSTGYGLKGMRERARAAGGTLTARPTPDGGFHVGARFPLPEAPIAGDCRRGSPPASYVLPHGRA